VFAASPDITIQPGKCWWCGAPADSREHRLKGSDLRREYGKPPYTDLRTLTRFSEGDRHDFRGPNSGLVKFAATLCARCNDTRSQPFDEAWDAFVSYIADHEADVVGTQNVEWADVLGPQWQARGADVERYVLKHAICRVVDELPGPITIAGDYIDYLDGGPRPGAMEIELAIDLGVVELLRVTRADPPPEQPDAAKAGFLGTTGIYVQQSQSTGQWAEPQSGIYYRYMGVFWRLGAGSATPFGRQRIGLDVTEEFFGPGFREALAGGGATPS
jgi:hypothetical protein